MCKKSCILGLLSADERSKSMLGRYAVSLAGHDRGKIYLVVGLRGEGGRGELILLADGKSHPAGSPKAKKPKHVQVLKQRDESVAERLAAGQGVDDSVLIHSLREFGKSRNCDHCEKEA